MRNIYAPLLAVSLFLLPQKSYEQQALSNTPYLQNFNTLNNSTTSDVLPAGWLISEVGSAAAADGKYVAGTGSGNTGNVYSFGQANSDERALGTLLSGTLTPTIGVAFTNTTGKTLTSLQIAYTGEQWRLGATNRPDQLDFQYSLNATSLTTGTWVNVNELDFVAPVTAGTIGALDGNATPNRTSLSFTLTGLKIPAGATFYFRWSDFNAAGSDDGLAVDDFSVATGNADTEAPVIDLLSPLEGTSAVLPSFKPVITFNEGIVAGTGNIIVKNLTSAAVQSIAATSPAVVIEGNKLTLNVRLQPNQQYVITLEPNALADAAGNGFAGLASWSFATGEQQLQFNFNDCSNTAIGGGWTSYNVSGAQTWRCSNFGANNTNGIQINGFASGSAQENEDWLISPAFDLSYFQFPVLSFTSRTEFSGPAIKLMVSTNYDGVSNPKDQAFTWTELNGYFGATGEWNTTTGLNLSAYKGAQVHLAFVYASSPAMGAARWTIDDFSLVNAATAPAQVLLFGPKQLELDYAKAGTVSTSQIITLQAYNLVADVQLKAPEGFELSADGNTYTRELRIAKEVAEGNKIAVYVRFAPAAADKDYTGVLTLASGSLAVPATQVSGTSLRALKVVNWNIEWFGSTENGPSNKNQQQQNVQTVLQRLNADVYALSEVVDTARLKAVVDAMPGYAYTISDFGSYTDNVNDPDYPGAQKLAFVYRTDVVKNLNAYGMLRTGASSEAFYNWSSGRFPYQMQAEVSLEGVSTTIRFALIHAKANTGNTAAQTESWARRKGAADELKDSLDAYFPYANVLVLGDFNDDLDVTIAPNIPGNTSSYISFLQDAEDYKPITLPLSLAGEQSTASYDNVIDHQLASNEMGVAYVPASARILTGVTSWVSNYSSSTSDHYPVMARYDVRYFQNPISFTGFAGTINGGKVDLTWNTSHEINSAYFVVERSRNGQEFSPVDSVAGLGSSREGKAYTLSITPWPGRSYYRLRVTGKDGSVRYSDVQIINMKSNSQLLRVSMSGAAVARVEFKMAAEGPGTLQLIDLNGKVYRTEQVPVMSGKNIRYFNTQNLPAGVYLVRLVKAGEILTEKIYIGK